jgi:hypothetical protein
MRFIQQDAATKARPRPTPSTDNSLPRMKASLLAVQAGGLAIPQALYLGRMRQLLNVTTDWIARLHDVMDYPPSAPNRSNGLCSAPRSRHSPSTFSASSTNAFQPGQLSSESDRTQNTRDAEQRNPILLHSALCARCRDCF